jgi:hypothetical protein
MVINWGKVGSACALRLYPAFSPLLAQEKTLRKFHLANVFWDNLLPLVKLGGSFMKSMLIAAMAASWLAMAPAAQAQQTQTTGPAWVKQTTVPFRGKQDDIFFVTPMIGWYGNGQGLLYHTINGGQTWAEIWKKPGTFVRALGFVDEKVGFLGNVGTDYFPGVTDEHPLYKTTDSGVTWTPVTAINGPTVKGICAIDVLKVAYINHGVLDYKTTIRVAGRVGGPAARWRR